MMGATLFAKPQR